MKVKDLIALLERQNPESNVKLMTQPNYPIEYCVYGIVTASGIQEYDGELDTSDDDGEQPASDVYILEGSYLGYGNRSAWDIANHCR